MTRTLTRNEFLAALGQKPRREKQFPPRRLAVLGELGPCVLRDPRDGSFHEMAFLAGRMLCATSDGREMFVVRPISDAGPVRIDARALEVIGLHERFVHRKSDGYYNCFIPPVSTKPKFAGEMAIITYFAKKGRDEEAEWVHYFEEPGEAPRYARLYHLGCDQYYFPRGPWKVTADGIEFANEK